MGEASVQFPEYPAMEVSASPPSVKMSRPNLSESECETATYNWHIYEKTFPVQVFPQELICDAKNEPERETSVSFLDIEDKCGSHRFVRGQEIHRPAEWQLFLKNGSGENGKNELHLVLACQKLFSQPKVPIWVKLAVQILDKSGSTLKSTGRVYNAEAIPYSEGKTHGIFVESKSVIKEKRQEYLEGGCLRLSVRMNIYAELPSMPTTSEDVDEDPPKKRRRKEIAATTGIPIPGLLESLNNLWTTRESAGDITLKCGGQEIKAHKFMLIAQSPTFRDMFNSNLRENELQEVKIEDLTPGTLLDMLEFLYLKDSAEFDWSNYTVVGHLLYAAEKYRLTFLSGKCFQALTKMMTVDNFGEIAKIVFMFDSEKVYKNEVYHFYECNQMTLNGNQNFINFAHEDFEEFHQLIFYRISR